MNDSKTPRAWRAVHARAACWLTLRASAWVLAGAQSVHAQSDASIALSVFPLAIVGAAGASAAGASGGAAGVSVGAGSAVVAAPALIFVGGAMFTVVAIDATTASARGMVLERASDGARVSVQVSGEALQGTALALGSVVASTAVASGVILSAAGAAIAFIPNELGKALLHHERLSK